MAKVKISEMAAVSSLNGADLFEVVQSGINKKATITNIREGIISLTAGYLPKAATSSTLGDSVVYESSGSIGIGTTSPDRKFHVEHDTAATNTVTYVQRLTSTSSGTPATGKGVGIEFEVETSSNNNEVGATIEAVVTNAGSGTEAFDIVFKTMNGGAAAAERMRINTASGRIDMPGDLNVVGTINANNGNVTISSLGVIIPAGAAFYLGPQNTNGTWRIVPSGDDLTFQQREAGTYNTKSTMSGA